MFKAYADFFKSGNRQMLMVPFLDPVEHLTSLPSTSKKSDVISLPACKLTTSESFSQFQSFKTPDAYAQKPKIISA